MECKDILETVERKDIWLFGSGAYAAAGPSPQADSVDWMRGGSGSQRSPEREGQER